MKAFFVLTLVVSVLWPLIMFVGGINVMAHNQYQYRHELLDAWEREKDHASAHLGLTQKELAKCDDYTANAYRESVYDGYRLGTGYGSLALQGLSMSALLFLASVLGLRAVGSVKRFQTQSSDQHSQATTR